MQNHLTIELVQTHLLWENPQANRAALQSKIESLQNTADLIILPEMFTTGFTMNAAPFAETMDGETTQWMKEIAQKRNTAVTGSIIINVKDRFFNRLLFVEPNGAITHYDKRHTFTLAGEDRVYEKGLQKIIINYKGWKICPQICYDLRFPVWSRNTEGYDFLYYVANWPKPRINAWDTLLQARAIENMCYCAGVNRVGIDGYGHEYTGNSAVYNMLGTPLATSRNEETVVVRLDKEQLTLYRQKLRFLEDMDKFTLK